MGWFNDALMAVAPGLAANRMRQQLAAKSLQTHLRKYDGAASGHRTAGWRGASTSANAETDGNAAKLRDRARDLERNNAWAAKALTAIVSNVVGTGIRCAPRSTNKRQTAKAAALWKAWAETTACDFDGRHDLYGLQSLVMQTAARDGEALVRFRRVKGGPVPLALQVLEPDFLDTHKSTGEGGNRVIQGVEIDGEGRAVAYWLYEQHPGETGVNYRLGLSGFKSNRIPAEQVARIYRQDRAGQLRGVTWFGPIMLPLRDLDDYEDAQLVRQKIAACFSVFVRDSAGAEEVVTSDDTYLSEKVAPGIIEILPPGKDISFANPPGVEGYSDYVRAVLRKVAAGLGITYETLTGDLSQTNFSGGRMAWIEMHRNIEAWRWRMLIPQLCVPVWERFVEAATIAGASLEGVACEWTAPRRELVNPKEEILGMVAEIRGGLTSWSEAARERGWDPDVLLSELKEDADRFDSAGLVLDCDPRRTTQQGQPIDTGGQGTPKGSA